MRTASRRRLPAFVAMAALFAATMKSRLAYPGWPSVFNVGSGLISENDLDAAMYLRFSLDSALSP